MALIKVLGHLVMVNEIIFLTKLVRLIPQKSMTYDEY